jgi:hypothetical protein
MPASQKKVAVSKFPLRLMPSVRRVAENFSQKEGVSLNQFINLAVAEKLAHLQQEEWLAHRPKPNPALIAKALDILDRSTSHAAGDFDKIPDGYVAVRRKYAGNRAPDRRKS